MNVEQAPHANLGTSWRLRTNFWRSLASHLARKYWVPDALSHVYDFANTLDLRRFVHHGARHETDDELKDAGDLAAWLVQRGLSNNGNKVSRGAFEDALRLRGHPRPSRMRPRQAPARCQYGPKAERGVCADTIR